MLTITVTLHFTSPPAIGAGAQGGFIKTPDGWPYIPASAFKGQLRHAVERAAQELTRSVCATHRKMCREADRACPACRIFGSPWIPGALHFEDLTLSGPPELLARREKSRQEHRPLQSPYRYGVGINRRRSVADEHLLYTTELIEPGAPVAFGGTLRGDLRLPEAAWVVAGLNLLQGIGKSKSAGLGWCHAEAIVQQDGAPVDAAQLRAALLQEVA
jgi:CRISPR/Cas system CSM-associated protein Csm3 (group 7 of RAMP superfamily)